MSGFLTEVALQLKANLSFLLGLGGMFTIAKSLLTGLFLLPKGKNLRPTLKADASILRRWLYLLAAASAGLLVAAGLLYFVGPVSTIDAEALKRPGQLITIPQRWAIAVLIAIAIAILLCDALSSVYRYRLGQIIAKAD
jgi:hypothetical protein